jgi:mono/diheme cytochrome c family protein
VCILKSPLARTFLIALIGIAFVSTADADGTAVYEARCASCHGSDGRADTGVGRALGISSFEGQSFTVEGIRKLLRENKSHGSIDGEALEGDLEALVEFLNALAGGGDA